MCLIFNGSELIFDPLPSIRERWQGGVGGVWGYFWKLHQRNIFAPAWGLELQLFFSSFFSFVASKKIISTVSVLPISNIVTGDWSCDQRRHGDTHVCVINRTWSQRHSYTTAQLPPPCRACGYTHTHTDRPRGNRATQLSKTMERRAEA